MIWTHLFESHFIPARRQTSWAQRKLMIVLHGRGDSLEPFLSFHRELKMPEMNYLLINGVRKLGTGYSWCGLPPFQKNGILKTRERLTQLLDDLQEQGWKAQNIFILGFSEGCLVGADFGMNYHKRLGGIIGVSGCINFFPKWKSQLSTAAKRTPWLMTHGLKDKVIEIEDTRSEVERLKQAGVPVEWIELPKKHEIEGELELPLIRKWVRNSERLRLS